MFKNINYVLLISALSISCASYSAQIDESLIQSPALNKDIPHYDTTSGIWEIDLPEPLSEGSPVSALLNNNLPAATSITLNQLFKQNTKDIFLTVPTAFSNTCKLHVGEFITRYHELKDLGIENICIFSHDTPQVLALWKLALFIKHRYVIVTPSVARDSMIICADDLLLEKFKKFRFVSLQEPSKGDDNEFATFLGITNFYTNGLGASYHRSAGIVGAQKVIAHAIQHSPRCTKDSSVDAIINELKKPH